VPYLDTIAEYRIVKKGLEEIFWSAKRV